MAQRRKWGKEEKLQILKEAEDHGVTETIRKYEISLGTYYGWKKKLELWGEHAFDSARQLVDPELKKLKEENLLLKKLLAEKELALSIKEDLLKKSLPQKKKR